MGKFGLGRNLTDLQTEMGVAPEISILNGAERVVVRQIPLAQIGVNPDRPGTIATQKSSLTFLRVSSFYPYFWFD